MPIAVALPPAPAKPIGGGYILDSDATFEMVLELAFSGAYVAGGEVVAPTFESLLKTIGAGTVMFVIMAGKLGYNFDYDYVNKKVIVRQGDNTNVAAAPGLEIPVAAYPAGLSGLAAGNRVRVLVKGN